MELFKYKQYGLRNAHWPSFYSGQQPQVNECMHIWWFRIWKNEWSSVGWCEQTGMGGCEQLKWLEKDSIFADENNTNNYTWAYFVGQVRAYKVLQICWYHQLGLKLEMMKSFWYTKQGWNSPRTQITHLNILYKHPVSPRFSVEVTSWNEKHSTVQ